MEINTKQSFLIPRQPSIDRRYRPIPDIQTNLFNSISEEDTEYDTESEEYSGSSCPSITNPVEGALVYLRMRPTNNETFSDNYIIKNNILITKCYQNETTNLSNKNIEKHFTFTDIFPSSVNQSKIFEICVKSKIQDEENFTLMTYGTSGSGKTFTLIGDLENPGVIPRTLDGIFIKYQDNIKYNPSLRIKNGEIKIDDDENTNRLISLRKQLLNNCADVKNLYNRVQNEILSENCKYEKSLDEGSSVSIWISFIEIYNEFVYDLLDIDLKSRKSLKIATNNGKVYIKNLKTIFVENTLEAYKLLTYGLKRVSYASTGINATSSRSHCIFFVDIIKCDQSYTKHTHISYKFCDLAGSERLGKTGNVGSRLKEAQRINTSLMVLGRCLDIACNNQNKKNHDVIPFRESKLTMILQSALLGYEKLSMIVNITPTEQFYEENLNVLGFSSIAQNIHYKPCQQKSKQTRFSWFANTFGNNTSSNQRFEELYEENITLRSEIERLQTLVFDLKKELEGQESVLRKELVDNFVKESKKRAERFEEHLLSQEQYLRKSFALEKETLKRHYEKKLCEQEYEIRNRGNEQDCELISEESDEYDSDENSITNSGSKKRRTLKRKS